MMGTSKFEGHALCVSDYEENYLYGVGTEEPFMQGISAFVLDAGGSTVRSSVPSAFEEESDGGGYFKDVREEYQSLTGRKCPPVMRVKITVEVEPLTDEESEKVWADHCAKLTKATDLSDESPGVKEG